MPFADSRTTRVLIVAAFALGVLAASPRAQAVELLWSTQYSSYGEAVRSATWVSPALDEEATDDFQVEGTIERLIVRGRNDCTFGCYQPPQPTSVRLRVYEHTPSGPGAVQYDVTIPAGDPGLNYNQVSGVGSLDITLSQPIQATGWHFLSVQVQFDDAFSWRWAQASYNNPIGATAMWRDNLAGGQWQQAVDYWGDPVVQDFLVDMYGCPAGGCPPEPLVAECGSWQHVPTPDPNGDARLYDVDVLAPWDAWAVGYFDGPIDGYYADRQQSLAMHWNGNAWSIVPTPNPAPNASTTQVSLEAVSAVSANDVWAVGRKKDQDAGGYTGGRVLAMHWDGFEWTDMNATWPANVGSIYTGASGEQFYDVAAIASDDVWMVGRYWREFDSGALNWPGVAMHWNGSGFDVHYLPMVSPQGDQFATAVDAVSSDDVWVVGDGTGTNEPAYVWHWDGSSWSHVPAPVQGADQRLAAVAALAADDVWVGGSYRDASYTYHPLIMHWDGSSWTVASTPAGGSDFAAFAPDDILTYGTNGWAHWDGTAWSQDDAPQIIPQGSITALEAAGTCDAWAVGWRNDVDAERALTLRLESTTNPADDTDGDGVLDPSDNCPTEFNPDQADCDADGDGDVCELTSGAAFDCNGNGMPDNCESFDDCNANGVPDECEADCNANGFPDACDIADATSADCNIDGVPDECETFADCNTNGINDDCDIAGTVSEDANANGFPDECEALGPDFATVTTIDDVVDFGGAQQMADLPGPDGLVSFREALAAANNTPGPQTVAFNIPRERWDATLYDDRAILRLDDGLFAVTDDETTLDFDTQTQFTGDTNPAGGEVGIYGFQANAWGVTAILVNADRCTIKGLGRVMQRGYGVEIRGDENRVIGSTISGPLYAGVYVRGDTFNGTSADNNVIGGTLPGEGNDLSAGNDGLRIDGPAVGTIAVGNEFDGTHHGVSIRAGASGTRIGGPSDAERNFIRGAGWGGHEGCPTGSQVSVSGSSGTLIENNVIGLTDDGLADFGQRGTEGVAILDSQDTVVRGNAIGGILTIGTNHCIDQRFGVAILVQGASSGTVVENNLVGVGVDGLTPVVNRAGIVVNAWPGSGAPTSTTIASGVVANSEVDGVRVGPGAFAAISANSIFDNGALGISLTGGAGNGGQPAPVLQSAASDGAGVTVSGTLSGPASRPFVVELFASPACDPSGAGEGKTFLGSLMVTTGAGGTATFEATVPGFVPEGEVITATATDTATGGTSEFSTCEAVTLVACTTEPPEVEGLMVDADMMTVTWSPMGANLTYDVARGSVGGLREGVSATCVGDGLSTAYVEDPAMPAPGEAFYYMVRATNECGTGPWGGEPREATSCP